MRNNLEYIPSTADTADIDATYILWQQQARQQEAQRQAAERARQNREEEIAQIGATAHHVIQQLASGQSAAPEADHLLLGRALNQIWTIHTESKGNFDTQLHCLGVLNTLLGNMPEGIPIHQGLAVTFKTLEDSTIAQIAEYLLEACTRGPLDTNALSEHCLSFLNSTDRASRLNEVLLRIFFRSKADGLDLRQNMANIAASFCKKEQQKFLYHGNTDLWMMAHHLFKTVLLEFPEGSLAEKTRENLVKNVAVSEIMPMVIKSFRWLQASGFNTDLSEEEKNRCLAQVPDEYRSLYRDTDINTLKMAIKAFVSECFFDCFPGLPKEGSKLIMIKNVAEAVRALNLDLSEYLGAATESTPRSRNRP